MRVLFEKLRIPNKEIVSGIFEVSEIIHTDSICHKYQLEFVGNGFRIVVGTDDEADIECKKDLLEKGYTTIKSIALLTRFD